MREALGIGHNRTRVALVAFSRTKIDGYRYKEERPGKSEFCTKIGTLIGIQGCLSFALCALTRKTTIGYLGLILSGFLRTHIFRSSSFGSLLLGDPFTMRSIIN